MAAKPVSMGLDGDDDDDDDFFFPNAGIVVLEFLDIIYGWGLILFLRNVGVSSCHVK